MAILDLVNTHGDVERGTYTIGALLIWPLCCEYFDCFGRDNYVKPDSDRLPDVHSTHYFS